jgi:putative hydrolase of the HAD superfamily
MLHNVKAILFDAVGTLIHPDPPAAVAYAEVGRRQGSCLEPAEVARRFGAAFAREEALDVASGLRTDEERERERWRRIVAEVLEDARDPAACFAELYRHFALPQSWRVAADAAAVLGELARRGYTLGMASNYDQRLRSVVEGLPELQALQHLVISAEVGWRKPAPQFFAAAAARLVLKPNDILYIGDDLVNDLEGARAAGSAALLFDPGGEAPDIPERVGRLTEVLTRLSAPPGGASPRG